MLNGAVAPPKGSCDLKTPAPPPKLPATLPPPDGIRRMSWVAVEILTNVAAANGPVPAAGNLVPTALRPECIGFRGNLLCSSRSPPYPALFCGDASRTDGGSVYPSGSPAPTPPPTAALGGEERFGGGCRGSTLELLNAPPRVGVLLFGLSASCSWECHGLASKTGVVALEPSPGMMRK